MAKPAKKAAAFASLNPDDMLQGGLPTDFRGTITAADYVKWDYDGSIDEPGLFVRLEIQPADGEDVNDGKPIVQHWSAGNLKDWVPSDEDGDEQEEGSYAARVGKRGEMNNNTNFAHLMRSILESGEAAKGKPFTRKTVGAAGGSIAVLVGLDAHWDRVPQEKRKGMVDLADDDGEGEKKSSKPNKRDILVVTEVFAYDPDGAAEAPATKPKKKPAVTEDEDEAPAAKKPAKKPAKVEEEEEAEEAEETEEATEEESEEDPFDAALAAKVAKEVTKAGGALKKGKLATLMLKAYATAKPKEKTKAVERCSEEDFLSDAARPWTYDEDTGVLTID